MPLEKVPVNRHRLDAARIIRLGTVHQVTESVGNALINARSANAAIAPLHDRMPVIMAPNHFGWWLKDDDGRSESHKMALGQAPHA